MAKVMNFVDQFGNTLAESYWRIVQINMSIADGNGMVLLYGYKDQAARAANRAPIGQRGYSVSGSAFAAIMAKHLTPGGPNIMSLCYTDIINVTNDVPDPTEEDPNHKKNFFDGAADDA